MLLRKLDMMTMAHGLEGRMPLLSSTLYARAPEEADLFRRGIHTESKQRLKNMLRTHIPSRLVDRPKSGFGFDPRVLFSAVPDARKDFYEAYQYLRARGVSSMVSFTEYDLWHSRPGIVFAAIILYRAICNTRTSI
jgi:asparagine synthetase B (glutamine-hydrolysing)